MDSMLEIVMTIGLLSGDQYFLSYFGEWLMRISE